MHKSNPWHLAGGGSADLAGNSQSPKSSANPYLPPLSISLMDHVAAQEQARQVERGLIKNATFGTSYEDVQIAC